MPSYRSSTRSGVLVVLNAHSHTGATYISSGLAVAVSMLRKKNQSPSSDLSISAKACSVQYLRIAAICSVWAKIATVSTVFETVPHAARYHHTERTPGSFAYSAPSPAAECGTPQCEKISPMFGELRWTPSVGQEEG